MTFRTTKILLLTLAVSLYAVIVQAAEKAESDSTSTSQSEILEKTTWPIAVRTNLLFDAILIPNIGVEVSLGKKFTVAGDWFYTWFSSDSRHRYWQTYGGYLTLRKYFGKKSQCEGYSQPRFCFTGHHVGVYLSGLTYDFEWGGKGYQADHFGFGGGVEYGYSMRIGRRFNLDFNLGVGFQDGEYKEYEPIDGRYVWTATRKRPWFGPTKAEVSLVWLLGPSRKAKGGGQ